MSGNVLLRPRSAARALHTHLEMGFDNEMLLRFVDPRKFGRVYLFRSTVELDEFLGERLGPDSLVDLDADGRSPRSSKAAAAASSRCCWTRRFLLASATCTPTKRCGRPGCIRCVRPTR